MEVRHDADHYLGRRLDETLYIGEDIEITILAIKDDEVRLGINVPKSVSIERRETCDRNH
ncbi:MAG: carbon storage regulator [Acidiferrobacterales bacterium]